MSTENKISQFKLDTLKARVEAVNLAHTTLSTWEKQVKDLFLKNKGKKIVKTTGEWIQSFEKEFPTFPTWKDGGLMNIYIYKTYGQICVKIQCQVNYSSFDYKGEPIRTNLTYDTEMFIGRYTSGVLTHVEEKQFNYIVFDFETVLNQLKEVKRLESLVSQVKSKVYNFQGII